MATEDRSVLVLLPQGGFDPTEVAVPYRYLANAGFIVTFATPEGRPGHADTRVLTGSGLGLWKPLLMADLAAWQDYQEMTASVAFRSPIRWESIRPEKFDAVMLPGGHEALGMRPYLESEVLQRVVAAFFAAGKPVGAICHGTLLAARSRSADTGLSVLYGRRTTGLTYWQEMVAWGLTCLYLGRYYRTYPTPLEREVISCLQHPEHFLRGPLPVARDTRVDFSAGFTVMDRNYLSARWPGDANRFGSEFTEPVKAIR